MVRLHVDHSTMLVGNKYLPFDIGYLFLHENDETVEEHASKINT